MTRDEVLNAFDDMEDELENDLLDMMNRYLDEAITVVLQYDGASHLSEKDLRRKKDSIISMASFLVSIGVSPFSGNTGAFRAAAENILNDADKDREEAK